MARLIPEIVSHKAPRAVRDIDALRSDDGNRRLTGPLLDDGAADGRRRVCLRYVDLVQVCGDLRPVFELESIVATPRSARGCAADPSHALQVPPPRRVVQDD